MDLSDLGSVTLILYVIQTLILHKIYLPDAKLAQVYVDLHLLGALVDPENKLIY